MIQADSDQLGCVCPDCGFRCRDCQGTDTVISREALSSLAADPRFQPEHIAENFAPADPDDDADWGKEAWQTRWRDG